MGQIQKMKPNINQREFNTIEALLSLTHFRSLGKKYKKNCSVFGSNENKKICFRNLLTFSSGVQDRSWQKEV